MKQLRPARPTPFTRSAAFDPDTIRSRLRELAFLHPSAAIHFRVAGAKGVPEGWETLHYSGGRAWPGGHGQGFFFPFFTNFLFLID